MVAKIIRSEFILNKNMILLFAAEIVALTVVYRVLIPGGGPIMMLGAILGGTLPASILARQSKFRANAVTCCLPFTRSKLILGKYASMGIQMVGSLIIIVALMLVLPDQEFSTRGALNADKLVNMVFATAMIAGILAPLVIYYGFMGIMVLFLGLNLVTLALAPLRQCDRCYTIGNLPPHGARCCEST